MVGLGQEKINEQGEGALKKMIDYEGMNRIRRGQKSALTRAVNSGSYERVEAACRKAVSQWNELGGAWPDDWAKWQRALDDALPYPNFVPRLEDLVCQ